MKIKSSDFFCMLGDWVQIIAWFYIIRSMIFAVIWGRELVLSIDAYKEATSTYPNGSILTQMPEISIVLAVIAMLLLLLYFVMGIMLLKACQQNDPNMLLAWIAYAVIVGLMLAFVYIVKSWDLLKHEHAHVLSNLCVWLIAEVMCLIVVSVHWKGMKASLENPYPVNKYYQFEHIICDKPSFPTKGGFEHVILHL